MTHQSRARIGLRRLQVYIGVALIMSAFAGTYLLLTDQSLWLLAVSHALGLVVVIVIDASLGALSLLSVRRSYLPSLAAAFLGVSLQLGDIVTAPQYGMTMSYFASYLLGLWAFDLLLGLQIAVLVVGLFGRGYAQDLARRRTRFGKQLSYSRRGFLKAIVSLAGIVGFVVLMGSIKVPRTSKVSTTSRAGAPEGAIANINDLQTNSPISFEHPQGYPNLLMKKNDGSLVALSLLCTHVCCECYYDLSSKEIVCPCHGSVFDDTGQVLQGPAVYPLPPIGLRTDSDGYIYPTGIKGSSPCLQQ